MAKPLTCGMSGDKVESERRSNGRKGDAIDHEMQMPGVAETCEAVQCFRSMQKCTANNITCSI